MAISPTHLSPPECPSGYATNVKRVRLELTGDVLSDVGYPGFRANAACTSFHGGRACGVSRELRSRLWTHVPGLGRSSREVLVDMSLLLPFVLMWRLAFDEARKILVLFGGAGPDPLDDGWEFANGVWKHMDPP